MSAKRKLSTSTLRRKSVRSRVPAEPRLVIEAGAPDALAVSDAIREWIVPVLVRSYLANRSEAKLSTMKLDTELLNKGKPAVTPQEE